MNQINLSVIVPVYNVFPYVEKCLESLEKQTYKNLEFILVDDGSSDGSERLCDQVAERDKRFRVIHQKNAGSMRAREAGIAEATGKYITFVDGDDWIEPDMYEKLMRHAGRADLICSGLFRETQSGEPVKTVNDFPEGLYEGEALDDFFRRFIYDFEAEVYHRFSSSLCNKIFRADLMQQVEYYLDYPILLDQDEVLLYQYIVKCNSILIVEECYYHYVLRKGSSEHRINEHILLDINHVYLALKKAFSGHKLQHELDKQLQKTITMKTLRALSRRIGFEDECTPIRFVPETDGLRGKKIVLYGAGECGKDFARMLPMFRIDYEKWADDVAEPYVRLGRTIEPIGNISQWTYDLVLLAVPYEYQAHEYKQKLLELGVDEERIIWRKAINIGAEASSSRATRSA